MNVNDFTSSNNNNQFQENKERSNNEINNNKPYDIVNSGNSNNSSIKR